MRWRKRSRDAGLGLNPASDGNTVKGADPGMKPGPPPGTQQIAQYAEQARGAVRNVRRDGMDFLKKLEKDGKITGTSTGPLSDQMQKLTDEHVKKVDETLAGKEKEILQV